MTGGTITDNTNWYYGAGVHLTRNNSKFIMKGGFITNNTAYCGGGVGLLDDCKFTMEGGTISGNTATAMGGGVGHSGVAVLPGYPLSNGLFTMIGGNIKNNEAPVYKNLSVGTRDRALYGGTHSGPIIREGCYGTDKNLPVAGYEPTD
jgi:hypothetical protein